MTAFDLVIIGASWGGLHAVSEILHTLPEDFPVPAVIVLHRQEGGDNLLAGLLDRKGPLNVVDAEDKSQLKPGCVQIAPPGYHVLIEDGHIELSVDAQVRHSRPSIDVAFESAAHAYGDRLVGVVLTGANEDGAAGLAEIARLGGRPIVQDPRTAERPQMPQAALEAVSSAHVCPLEEIGPLLVRLAKDEVTA